VSTVAAPSALERDLAAITGSDYVVLGQTASAINGVVPAAEVSPGSAEEVAAILKLASARGLVVAPAGGFTKQQAGGIPECIDVLLRLDRLNHIEHYDPGDLTCGAGAGMTFADLQRELAKHLQWIPCDPPNPERATIGGLLATADSGPLKSGFGGLRDFCIGIQFVTADGKIAKGGGRVVKNVAGYDLMKLMIGSYGSLAVITKANFKVCPSPRQTRAFICSFASSAEALVFRDRVQHSPLTPICLEIISPRAAEYLSPAAAPRDPDIHAPTAPLAVKDEWQIALRAAGSDNVLARYRRVLGSAVSRELDGAAEEQFWTGVRQFEHSVLARHRNAMIVHTNVTLQHVETAVKALERAAPDYNFFPALLGRAATGNLIAAFVPLAVDPPASMQYANCASAFRALLPPDSSAMVLYCPKEAKAHFDVWGSSPTDLAMMRAVKHAVDPQKILNRGRFIV
jgi:glycolate dehydrogenase FAD-binding subunit